MEAGDDGLPESEQVHESATMDWMNEHLEGTTEDNHGEQNIELEPQQCPIHDSDRPVDPIGFAQHPAQEDHAVNTQLPEDHAPNTQLPEWEDPAAAPIQRQKTKHSTAGPTAPQQRQTVKQTISRGAGSESRRGNSASKQCLASVFQESKLQDVELKSNFIEKKVAWKLAELKDKKEARVEEFKRRRLDLEFEAEQKKIDRTERLKEKKEDRENHSKEARKERLDREKQAKQKNRLDLILAGWAQNKSPEEITQMLTIMDT